MSAQNVNDSEFENEVLKAAEPVLVDFWAEWCGPCKMFAPTLDEYAAEAAGKIKVVKVNVDESPDAPTKYGVRSIPTLMVFKNGEVVAKSSGAMAKSALQSWVQGAI